MNILLFIKRKKTRQAYDSKSLPTPELNLLHILPWIIHKDRKSSGWLDDVFSCSYSLSFAGETLFSEKS